VLLLNTDVILQERAVELLRDFLETHPKAAMAGGQLFHGDGRKQNSFAPFPSLLTELTNKGLLRILFPRKFSTRTPAPSLFRFLKRNRRPACPDRQDAGSTAARIRVADQISSLAPLLPSLVDSLVGACMLVRAEAICQVGLLDEDYFFFLEETDWCYRFRKEGWTIGYVPQARIIHLQGQTAKAYMARARIEFCPLSVLSEKPRAGLINSPARRSLLEIFLGYFGDHLFESIHLLFSAALPGKNGALSADSALASAGLPGRDGAEGESRRQKAEGGRKAEGYRL
jgi:GT2 family glycosyltransferase